MAWELDFPVIDLFFEMSLSVLEASHGPVASWRTHPECAIYLEVTRDNIICYHTPASLIVKPLGSLLLTWFDFNPSMDK